MGDLLELLEKTEPILWNTWMDVLELLKPTEPILWNTCRDVLEPLEPMEPILKLEVTSVSAGLWRAVYKVGSAVYKIQRNLLKKKKQFPNGQLTNTWKLSVTHPNCSLDAN